MACTVCLVCLINTVSGRSKKRRKNAKNMALVAGAQQNLSNLFLKISICRINLSQSKIPPPPFENKSCLYFQFQ